MPGSLSCLHAAIVWLDAPVPHGAQVEARIMITAAVSAGHALTTLRQARWRLRIESRKDHGYRNPPWLWER